jgi:hypothetical protein
MEILALIVGFIGGVCTILGIITGVGALQQLQRCSGWHWLEFYS